MNEDIDALSVRINRLLTLMKKLSDDNIRLRAELEKDSATRQQLEASIKEARVRVEAALARLPLTAESEEETA
ncbi:MAG: hypothetical protein WA888_05720 [Burkholderiaceae bacterium]